jgi:hypothetical protein
MTIIVPTYTSAPLHTMDYRPYWTSLLAVLAGLVLLAAAGCSKEKPTLPETYPVHGKVVFQDGQPVAGGSITFESETDKTVSTVGTIDPDGTFTLRSFKVGVRSPGAIAGPHRVTIVDAAATIRAVPGVYVVKPGENVFTLTIPKVAGSATIGQGRP